MNILRWLRCHLLRDHDWTCAAAQGIKATPEQLAGGVSGFMAYNTMYCNACGKVYHL